MMERLKLVPPNQHFKSWDEWIRLRCASALSFMATCHCQTGQRLVWQDSDLWFLLAQDRCTEMCLPKGSCSMAPQTIYNLQGCALVSVVMTITLQEEWAPWRNGQCRLWELPIEERFSLLRRQSSNAQLSCRHHSPGPDAQTLLRKVLKDVFSKIGRSKSLRGNLPRKLGGASSYPLDCDVVFSAME